jgi:hypothetical protein
MQAAMRRLFYILGVVFAVLIIGLGGLSFVLAYQSLQLAREAKAYADQAIVDIAQSWDRTEFLQRAAPELLTTMSPQQIATVFEQLAHFGKLIKYGGATGSVAINIGAGAGTTAHCEAEAVFANGQIHFRMDLIRTDGSWMISSFSVDWPHPPTTPDTRLL